MTNPSEPPLPPESTSGIPSPYGSAPSTSPASQAYPGQSGYPAAPYPYGAYPAPQRANGLALTSMILGIAGWVLIPFLTSIGAVITGHIALSQLRTRPETGRGFAIAGLVLGYTAIALWLVVVLLVFSFWGMSTAGSSL